MGQNHVKRLNLSKEDLTARTELLRQFSNSEKQCLMASFQDLANRSPGPTIDRKTFLETFPLPGLYGEQLFSIFDEKKTGVIDNLEFLSGLATCLKGSYEEKITILFRLFDISADGLISRQELETMLHQVSLSELNKVKDITFSSKKDLIEQIVTDIFSTYDNAKTNYLSQNQFRSWVRSQPQILDFLDSVFGVITNTKDIPRNLSYEEQLCAKFEVGISEKTVLKEGYLQKCGKKSSLLVTRYCVLRDNLFCSYKTKQNILQPPRGIIILTSCDIEVYEEIEKKYKSLYAFKIQLPFNDNVNLSPKSDNSSHTKIFYCKTSVERDNWVKLLQNASKVRKFKEFYVLKNLIGSGKFANVHECSSIVNKAKIHAVKLLKKEFISSQEKELLRTEIAILKIVEHDNIVKLVDVFEDTQFIQIVTELVTGGELFQFIAGRNRFNEEEGYFLLSQLLEGIEYLHSAGIMHRDLKPENILLQWNNDEYKQKKVLHGSTKVKLTDFGLSKMVHPNQQLDMPCGTISYVAPEVLASAGYDVTADIWSIGVIMFLVLRGKLPFDGEGTGEVLDQMNEYKLNQDKLFKDQIWEQFDPQLVDIISIMLKYNPEERQSAAKLKQHPWMVQMAKRTRQDPNSRE